MRLRTANRRRRRISHPRKGWRRLLLRTIGESADRMTEAYTRALEPDFMAMFAALTDAVMADACREGDAPYMPTEGQAAESDRLWNT